MLGYITQFSPIPSILAPVYIKHKLVPPMVSVWFGKYNIFPYTWWRLFHKELAKAVCAIVDYPSGSEIKGYFSICMLDHIDWKDEGHPSE